MSRQLRRTGKKQVKCLCCKNKAQSRGLCWTCRAAARVAVQDGTATEESLISDGLLLPAKKLGRKKQSGFALALARKK